MKLANTKRRNNNPNVDIGLAVLCVVTPEGETMSQRDIAEVCNCSRALISRIEFHALEKAKLRATQLGLEDFLE